MALTKEDLQSIAGLIQPLRDDINGMKSDINIMKDDIINMKSDINIMKDDIVNMKSDINIINNKINILNQKVTSLEIHFENVTDKNIRTIAEGHLDLSRKLDDALKVENEKELLIIRVRIIEDELRKMKERPNQIA